MKSGKNLRLGESRKKAIERLGKGDSLGNLLFSNRNELYGRHAEQQP